MRNFDDFEISETCEEFYDDSQFCENENCESLSDK